MKSQSLIRQSSFAVQTTGRGTYDVSRDIAQIVEESGIEIGMCHVFVQHTSASLIICENADPSVRRDLESFMARTVQDGASYFEHTAEGPDDMSAHIRTILTTNTISVPVCQGTLGLGTWQGIYLWEHRTHDHRRRLVVTVQGAEKS
ncbi:MAG: secondary thiamine-phosphate synthase [Myxococcales bacterium]|nr:secondary thiamine-phosphate synthase [Myxococcales bacterium]